MKNIPEFDFDISQATQYILESELAQKALEQPPFPNYTNICREVISSLSKLANTCNMPEFTNHGLQHICSLVKRASEWGRDAGWLEPGNGKKANPDTYALCSQEAGYLLLALLLHDIGMLSQDPKELPDGQTLNTQQGFADIAGWVRRTHVARLPKLVKNLLKSYMPEDGNTDPLTQHMDMIIHIAASHNYWPWDAAFAVPADLCSELGIAKDRAEALNAIVAVCDLLDEDSNRCDSVTLLEHKYGTTVNRAHWYRHALTVFVEGVKKNGIIDIKFRSLPHTPDDFYLVFRALRNHFRLVQLYNDWLAPLHAQIVQINFLPGSGIPETDSVSSQLGSWKQDVDFRYCITARILDTFMPEARNEESSPEMRKRLDRIGMESMDLSAYDDFLHPGKPYMPEEKLIYKIIEELHRIDNPLDEINQLNQYVQSIVEQAYLVGEIGKVKTLCTLLLEQAKKYVEAETWYWIYIYMLWLYEQESDAEFIKALSAAEPRGVYRVFISAVWQLMQVTDAVFMRDEDCVKGILEMVMGADCRKLRQDGPTELLLKLLLDAFYYHLDKVEESELQKLVQNLERQKPCFAPMIEAELDRLRYQLELPGGDINRLNEQDRLLAEVWSAYAQMDMHKLDQCLARAAAKLERSYPHYIAFQKIYNLTRWQREYYEEKERTAYDADESEEQEPESVDDAADAAPNKKVGNVPLVKTESKTDSYRLRQQEKDNPKNSMHVGRMNEIKNMVGEMELDYTKGDAVYEKETLNRLFLLEQMHALRSWDIVKRIVLRQEEAQYHKLVGLSVPVTNKQRKSYRDRQLSKAVLYSIEGQISCLEPKKDGYWIGSLAELAEPVMLELTDQLLGWKNPSDKAIVRSWLEELGDYIPECCLDRFIDWIITNCEKPMDSIVIYYALPMTVCRSLFDRTDMTDERWKRLEEVFVCTLKNEFYWRSNHSLCVNMLKHLNAEKQLEILRHAAAHTGSEPFYANCVINIAVEVSKHFTGLAKQCSDILMERQNRFPDNPDYDKYSQIVLNGVISSLPRPDVAAIREALRVIFQKREEQLQNNDMRTISLFQEASELLNNENWAAVTTAEIEGLIELIMEYYWKLREALMANEVVEFYRMIYLLAKNETCIPRIIEEGIRMNICMEDVKLSRTVVDDNAHKMMLPTNLNNGYAYGFMMLADNLAVRLADEQLEIIGDWANRSFAYAEDICEYYYAYFWIYLLKAAKHKENARLEHLAQIGVALLNLKMISQQERSFEKKEDTLLSVLSAWKSYYEIQQKQASPMDCTFPEELELFLEAGRKSWFYEKQRLCE